jgi:hypothetical protein
MCRVEEVRLKIASLLKPLRYLALMLVVTSSADASQYCWRAKQLPPISDPMVKGRIEQRLQAIPVMKNHQVGLLSSSFALAWQDEEQCAKTFRCYHLLLDIRNGTATIVFAYQGSGTIYQLGTPPFAWSDPLQDYYSLLAFETDDSNWVEVRTPRLPGPVWVGAKPSDDRNMTSCGFIKHE